jgi:ribose 5-phosphate isomerase B
MGHQYGKGLRDRGRRWNSGQAMVADQAAGRHALSIILGGFGNGEQMAVTQVPGIRAALLGNPLPQDAQGKHNDANVVPVGGRQHVVGETMSLTKVFLEEHFSEDKEPLRRIAQMSHYELSG